MDSFDVSTKSDVVNLIIFKRKLRQLLNNFTKLLAVFFLTCLICFCIYHRTTIINTIKQINMAIKNISDQLFATKIDNIRIQLLDGNKNSLLNDDEIKNMGKQIKNNKKIDKAEMKKIVKKITTANSLIENIYIRKNLSKNEIVVFLKEREVIGILYNDCGNAIDEKCAKNIISSDNKLYPYHNLKSNDKILKIYGKISPTINLQNIYKILKKYSLLHKIAYIKFYSSGRFDAILKNKLVVKFPRQNLVESVQKFKKLDTDFFISSDTGLKYIDLRVSDKLFIMQDK